MNTTEPHLYLGPGSNAPSSTTTNPTASGIFFFGEERVSFKAENIGAYRTYHRWHADVTEPNHIFVMPGHNAPGSSSANSNASGIFFAGKERPSYSASNVGAPYDHRPRANDATGLQIFLLPGYNAPTDIDLRPMASGIFFYGGDDNTWYFSDLGAQY